MYHPTEAELLEMGFNSLGMGVITQMTCYLLATGDTRITCSTHETGCYVYWGAGYKDEPASFVYPQSKEDVLTLIRLFTAPE